MLYEASRAGDCFSLHGDNKERSYEALKDFMIFHLVHSHNGQREKVKSTLTVVTQENGLYCKEKIITFSSGTITHSLTKNVIIHPVNLL